MSEKAGCICTSNQCCRHPQVLHVMGNQLTELPADLTSSSSLRDLNAADNLICALPSGWGGMTALASLVLYGNDLGELPDDLVTAPNLQSLWLEGNRLQVRGVFLPFLRCVLRA
jgi:Leucine-rich repeat (LRR) protein